MIYDDIHSECAIRMNSVQLLDCIWQAGAPYHLSIAYSKLTRNDAGAENRLLKPLLAEEPISLTNINGVEYRCFWDEKTNSFIRLFINSKKGKIALLPVVVLPIQSIEEPMDKGMDFEDIRLRCLNFLYNHSITIAKSFAKKHGMSDFLEFPKKRTQNRPTLPFQSNMMQENSEGKYEFNHYERRILDYIREERFSKDAHKNIYLAFNEISREESRLWTQQKKLKKNDGSSDEIASNKREWEAVREPIPMIHFIKTVAHETDYTEREIWMALLRLNAEGIISCRLHLNRSEKTVATSIFRGEGSYVLDFEPPLLKAFIDVLRDVYRNHSSEGLKKLLVDYVTPRLCDLYNNPTGKEYYKRLIYDALELDAVSTVRYYGSPSLTDEKCDEARILNNLLDECFEKF
jgi:hypothetical protein